MAFPETVQKTETSSNPPNGMENSQTSQRSNHVSSVLLYGIPIVSLYIEGQERLCLAQISNTLLKQFSYNEIHNRRVALGITCVQCTPVQLEILRRAGAMPVSSRRCGMITRREAERLCKSFLGDNSPPRLPDDFAFNVQHKCAWGCRGSFLPSRYNSSRAKCIKCAFCGMFFSPNKFIFHSHRITTNDRYVQPDAANFNSWRRHMTLSGNAHDEKIIYAWEDVKAMFNGGTRKRLVSSNSNVNRNRNQSSPTSSSATTIIGGSTCSSPTDCEILDTKNIACKEAPLSKRSVDHQYNYSTVAAAAAVVGVTAVAAATVGVPFNLHHSSVLSPLHSLRNDHDLAIMPLSRNFVVDYMWQQQDGIHQQQQSKNSKICGAEPCESALDFESCPMPWARAETNMPSTTSNAVRLGERERHQFNMRNETSSTSICGIIKNRKLSDVGSSGLTFSDYNIPSILSCSAFKPVVASAAIVSTSLYTRSSDSNSNVYITPTQTARTTTVLTHNSITTASHRLPTGEGFSPILDTIQSNIESERSNFSTSLSIHNKNSSDKSISSESAYGRERHLYDNDDDDDEVVDIETTEDEVLNEHFAECPHSAADISSESESSSHSQTPSTNIDVDADADVDVDGITTDAEDQLELKSNVCLLDNTNRSISNSNGKVKMAGTSLNAEPEICEEGYKCNEETKGFNGHLRIFTRGKSFKHQPERNSSKKATTTFSKKKFYSKSVAIKSAQSQVQHRVAFPVFFKSQVNPFNEHHPRPTTLSPNSLSDSSNAWSYPLGNIRQLYCYESSPTANKNCVDFK
ncbi:uncharacterized protein fuss [Drosophila pseudoobscura]|uniref:Uncharacterized protein fuss n=1 Tax=Drosophila pseudoobscura pseudoobscura TaxID=46245 RepID=A0A6I8W198_DROPS|nr:uncharacterized protein LOC6899880 [Drosophila pseudoobscura]XP_033237126.1 uncharacterized protein LOC6899880 [Drosophila pseudoobscura]XP_033237127.1 uncharacterized protein LOC6899880 [Drosophila pseudoobscura]XP_033237128.1 uncharacterized protein LOC6899880 [Drosophila pseudoobscura]XP_033237129.1 uncharacterized protein LOC6899880 [Drosophila pseudoobscura]XP_033237130.1 uncharacterized protein LOC6899880 [Drosophila pseudoobscura]XP_033237131.1 uncharacterized protein LOC6899880 [Dr